MDDKTQTDSQKIGKTLYNDVRRGDFLATLRREFKDLRDFMLTEERQRRLREMRRVKRWLFIAWWLLKSLVLKLTPARRLLLVLGLLFITNVESKNDSVSVHFTGSFLIVFVLMLELKDKLIAQSELREGHAVQEALMPERTPNVPGWSLWLFTRSANEVGGDLVDFILIDENRFGVALGDVAGKGLRAALLTAKLQATVRALAPDFSSLDKFGAKLNQIFCRDSLPNLFASLVYLEVGPHSGSVRLLNAGHIPPFVIKGREISKMEKGGMALGLTSKASFTEQYVDLQGGNLLCVYSDGLTEARNESGEFFGDQRLMETLQRLDHLPTQQIGERLVGEVERFVGDARTYDDLSVVLIRKM